MPESMWGWGGITGVGVEGHPDVGSQGQGKEVLKMRKGQ